MSFTCPKGHDSKDKDYCSECGTKIEGGLIDLSLKPNNSGVEACPSCNTERIPGNRYCEICRYDFQNNVGTVKQIDPVFNQPSVPSFNDAVQNDVVFNRFEVQVLVEPSPDWDQTIPLPVDTQIRAFPLDLEENLVGRYSDQKDVHPEIPIGDPGISRRHLKLLYRNNTLSVLELGSTNGTHLNKVILKPGIEQILNPGDELTLGMWTKLIIKSR